MATTVKVQQQGGFLGLDRSVEIQDRAVTVMEKGEVRHAPPLSEAMRDQLDVLTARVIETGSPPTLAGRSMASDAMTNTIAIEDGPQLTHFQVTSGDDAPDEIWDLIDLVSKIPT